VVLVLVPFLLVEGPTGGWLRDLGVLDRDERFTELFFPDRRSLPPQTAVGSPLAFDIALHNREGRATSYRWKAEVSSAGTEVELARGDVRLEDGDVRRIHVVGTTPPPVGPAVVRVTLVARPEAIDFRTAVVAPGAVPAAPG
jgi:hypothetical protein